jgi:hypothetical protein
MGLAGGTRATAVSAAVFLLGGIAVILHGIIQGDLTRALSGTCLTLPALTLIALVFVRRWVCDTHDERRALAAAQLEAERQRTRYVAAQAALENEQQRLHRDIAAERARIAAQLKAERANLDAEFEERRATLVSETMEATFLMMRSGKLAPDEPRQGKLIHFPKDFPIQEPAPARQRDRSREHGVVGP